MLDASLKSQVQTLLQEQTQPIEIVAWLDDSDKAREMRGFLKEVAGLSPRISFVEGSDADERKPSFSITHPGKDLGIRFATIPGGHEFTSFVMALVQVGGRPMRLEPDVIEQIKNIKGEYSFETYISLSCQNCPEVVQALNMMSLINPNIRQIAIDGELFQDEIAQRQVMAVPTIYLNGEVFGQGRMNVEEFIAKLDSGAAARDAAKLTSREPYDVLIVGGGPAGAAAAVYAARKGIRTGVLAERFGGQVLDTMDIENFISVKRTEGPSFAAALEEHVRSYGVDIMNTQRAQKIERKGNYVEVTLANGGVLKSRTVILSTGARWREMGVPGENQYRTRGVAFCPHCDGPLYKGKPIAVVGGGNSGVEAAIDLAGVVKHVTLLEYGPELRADAVLQQKLRSMPNVTIITEAQTTEIPGDGNKVNGLCYKDRRTGDSHTVPLEGVFVQIGLVPNTDWLKESEVKLSKFGEIEIDAKGNTSMPGVFAAGDCTTVPYKQIIIASGDGAKAALSAFDYLIRNSVTSEKIAA